MKASRSKDLFRFKQFEVNQNHCAMKVSTDGVVLGALVDAENAFEVMEIGVGTGVVSLMLAQRFPQLHITGLEIDKEACLQAAQNASNSPWPLQVTFVNQAIQDYTRKVASRFDLIVTNPPYYPDHLLSPDSKKNTAHHNLDLSFEDILSSVQKHLTHEGNLWIILPLRQMSEFTVMAERIGIFPIKEILLADRPGKKPIRSIVNFNYEKKKPATLTMVIKNFDGSYSETYSELLKDFLLIF